METHKMKRQLSTAYRYAFTRLTLNYYTYYESMAELDVIPPVMQDCNNRLNKVMKGFFDKTASAEDIAGLREHVKHQMEIVTAYADCCINYEYSINRIERRFMPDERRDLNSHRFFQAMSDFILQSEDGAVMNTRISAAISQMPVRLTKVKFFSLLETAMAPFKGASREALEEQMYLLRTSSMLDLPKDMTEGYEDMAEALVHLETMDYKTVTEEQYWERKSQIVYISDNVRDYSTAYRMLVEIVNDLYVMILAKPEAMVELQEEELLTVITTAVLENFMAGEKKLVSEEIGEKLELLEGKQENYLDRYMEHQILAQSLIRLVDPMTKKMFLIDLLLSGSPFASLERRPESESGTVGQEYLTQELGKFKSDLEARFNEMSKPVIRAVMAKILSSLPIWFTDSDDMLAFLRNSLESCTDQKEKQTSMELMKKLMERG